VTEKARSAALKTIGICEDDPGVSAFLKELLSRSGYTVVGHVTNGVDAIHLVRTLKPQLLILDLHMPGLNGMDVLMQVVPMETTAVIMLTADQTPGRAREAMDLGASGYALKPCEGLQLIPMLESAWHRYHMIQSLQAEKKELVETLATRKLLDQAKGILMEQQGFTEEQAHRMLQKMSQDQGIPIKDVCRSLIQVKLVLGRNAARAAKTLPKS